MATIRRKKCSTCGKVCLEESREVLDGVTYVQLECGHLLVMDNELSEERDEEASAAREEVEIVSKDGRKPFPFQWETVRFAEKADCNCLILHEQGLGKTVIACMLLKRNPKLLPALIVAPSGLRLQWMAEVYRWAGIMPQVIMTSSDKPMFDTFDVVIVSVDMLARLRPDVVAKFDANDLLPDGTTDENGFVIEKRDRRPRWTDEEIGKFKTVIIDESQKIKNSGSSRTQVLRAVVGKCNNGEGARVMPMSGTNIEKHAGEFFVTLNLARPEMFPSEFGFRARECEVHPISGKIMGLKYPDAFRAKTKDFIIRYKRADVLPDLPKVFRHFRLAEMEGGLLKEYQEVVKEFQEFMDTVKKATPTDILGYLSRMRHITGVAKVNAASEYLEEFLLDHDNDEKIVVFLHHKRAAVLLEEKLRELCKDGAYNPPLLLHADLNVHERTAVVEEFKKPGNRVLIASTLAAGVGLNLQFCSHCLVMERQWNPAQEEQAEGRFPRPDSTADKIEAVYLIAAGTIDDFLTEIVEQKRRNVAQTLDGEEVVYDETSIIMELARVLQAKGMSRWQFGKKKSA